VADSEASVLVSTGGREPTVVIRYHFGDFHVLAIDQGEILLEAEPPSTTSTAGPGHLTNACLALRPCIGSRMTSRFASPEPRSCGRVLLRDLASTLYWVDRFNHPAAVYFTRKCRLTARVSRYLQVYGPLISWSSGG
jgi:hypothetical protein